MREEAADYVRGLFEAGICAVYVGGSNTGWS